MKIRQIGNGGAFNFDQTNSSFLIKTDEGNFLLFDCGRNVIDKLHKLEHEKTDDNDFSFKELKYIYISHMDDDHIGSLKSLIYYMFFVVGVKPIILFNKTIASDLEEYLKYLNSYTENGVIINEKLYIPLYIQGDANMFDSAGTRIDGGIYLSSFEVNHSIHCAGLRLTHEDGTIFISGDTTDIVIPRVYKANVEKPRLVFQDFSTFDNINKQVHLCRGKFFLKHKKHVRKVREYFENYAKGVKFYHTGFPHQETFMTIDDGMNLVNTHLLDIEENFYKEFGAKDE